jgi:hypothetical protein
MPFPDQISSFKLDRLVPVPVNAWLTVPFVPADALSGLALLDPATHSFQATAPGRNYINALACFSLTNVPVDSQGSTTDLLIWRIRHRLLRVDAKGAVTGDGSTHTAHYFPTSHSTSQCPAALTAQKSGDLTFRWQYQVRVDQLDAGPGSGPDAPVAQLTLAEFSLDNFKKAAPQPPPPPVQPPSLI